MIHEIIEKLIKKIKNRFAEVICDYYKGEFEEGSEWNPQFPSVFLNCTQLLPGTENPRYWIDSTMTMNIYVGIKLEITEQQNFLDEIIKFVNRLNDDSELNEIYVFRMNSITLKGYFYGIEVYQIELSVNKIVV